MKFYYSLLLVLSSVLTGSVFAAEPSVEQPKANGKVAPKPLFRDPVFDGAADPSLCYNRQNNKWYMLYTNRRATLPDAKGVDWVHGTKIGVAESSDGGVTWKYLGTTEIDYGKADYTFWAPEVLNHNGTYHMYLSIVPGIYTDWNATRHIVHLTSKDLMKWKYESTLKLASDKVIDACVIQLPDGTWRMWYKNERDHSWLYHADSPNLYDWTDRGVAVNDQAGEGPKVFQWKGRYWMVSDVWDGLAVRSSDDCVKWSRQKDNLLKNPGRIPTDQAKGQHPDIVINGDRAYIFYFTHQDGKDAVPNDPFTKRRTVIQVAELHVDNGQLTCDRDKPTYISLQNPDQKAK
jgi:hypothetical protein